MSTLLEILLPGYRTDRFMHDKDRPYHRSTSLFGNPIRQFIATLEAIFPIAITITKPAILPLPTQVRMADKKVFYYQNHTNTLVLVKTNQDKTPIVFLVSGYYH